MSSIALYSKSPAATGIIRMGEPLAMRVSYSARKAFRPVLGVGIKTVHGAPIFNVSDRFARQLAECVPAAHGTIVCAIEEVDLLPGTYTADLWLGDEGGDFDMIQDAISFEVVPADLLGTGSLPSAVFGPVFRKATWRLLPDEMDGLPVRDENAAAT
jgi:lipopolysaccharide transport system ATP-binding protein